MDKLKLTESLSPKVIHSGFWIIGGNWLSRGLGIIKIIILARLLSPLVFGILGLAVAELIIQYLPQYQFNTSELRMFPKDVVQRAKKKDFRVQQVFETLIEF